MTVSIPLTKGLTAIVDESDLQLVSQFKWHAQLVSRRGDYCAGTTLTVKKRHEYGRRCVLMHQLILGFPGCMIDHRDGNRLNNTRRNLRPCTSSQNQQNRGFAKHSSRFKGVSWRKETKRWQANIRGTDKIHYLGLFDVEEDAALAYDKKAIQLFGDFARLNFPLEARQ